MTMRFRIVLFFIVFIPSVYAQPGGGGGLRILNILDYSGKPIRQGDANLRIIHFALSKSGEKQSSIIPPGQNRFHTFYDESNTFYYLPPYIQEGNKKTYIPNQRIQLIYSEDTMTIDFIGVMNENGAGHSDMVENIHFNPGYYKSFRNPNDIIEGFGEKKERNDILKAMYKGINTNTDYILKARGLLVHIPDPDSYVKQLKRNRKSCTPEIITAPYSRLCAHQLNIQDSTIHLIDNSGLSDFKDSSLLHYVYYFSFNYRSRINPEVQLATTMLESFKKSNLRVNQMRYTGTLKLAVPFHNAGISSSYSGYNLWILEYSKGILTKIEIKNDVSLITEQVQERPH